ncbi:unnamed protein product [Clavelina lepadiformis]|uniref:Calcium-activated chloride channel N-terminal domain-containing protein n=1 Tax=Clavelina lepadiformis TaxID=159417 RepID=A0ABP0FRR4_CLALP
MKVLSLWFSFCLLTSFDDVIVSSLTVTISNNGYHGLLIAINFEVPESSQLIDAIKEVWTNASKPLYTVTKQRAYFDQITILVPKFWIEKIYQTAGRETYDARSYNIHNKEAPNEQNRMCNLRSTWEVILDSNDFANSNSPNVTFLDTTPMFGVVKPTSSKRYVLVSDISESIGWVMTSYMYRVEF